MSAAVDRSDDALFLRACRGERVERTPIWMMRQAGRALPEYRKVRERADFLTMCRTPELATEVTLQPVRRLGVDAAILFSDIMVPAEAMGVDVRFEPGPVIDDPVRSAADVERLASRPPEEAVGYVMDAVRLIRRELDGRVPLIGFAAAPWTLATYLVEGGGSKQFDRVRALALGEPRTMHALLERITETTVAYLEAQVRAGAQALQLFDTWAGLLGPIDYREHGLRWVRETLERLRPLDVPLVYFAFHAAHLAPAVAESGADVLGVDWRTDLRDAAAAFGGEPVLQGNLEPAALLASRETLLARADDVLAAGRTLRGHVFNLGHGVLPTTPVENLHALVEHVKTAGVR